MCCWKNRFGSIAAFFIALLVLAGCDNTPRQTLFYPVDSLVNAQVRALTATGAMLHKRAVVGAISDTSAYVPADTTGWLEELEIFRQLDVINKPVNAGSYLVDENSIDPGSNLRVKSFTGVNEDLAVRYLRVYYDQMLTKPRKIEALYREQNSLYSSSRAFEMEFQHIHDNTLLTRFSITGGQKIILGDSVAFTVEGRIQIP